MLAETRLGQHCDEDLSPAQLPGDPGSGARKSGMAIDHILSRFRGALRMMLSTRSNSSAASEAEDTTARFSL